MCVGLLSFSVCGLAEDVQYNGPMSQQAEKSGITTCLSAIKKVDKFLYEKAGPNGVSSTWNTNNADVRGFTSLGSIKYSDGTWGYDMTHISPTKGGSCDGALTRVVTFPNKSCSSVRESTYKSYDYKGEIAGKALYGKDGIDLFLEDLTGSCIAIRVEPLYGM